MTGLTASIYKVVFFKLVYPGGASGNNGGVSIGIILTSTVTTLKIRGIFLMNALPPKPNLKREAVKLIIHH